MIVRLNRRKRKSGLNLHLKCNYISPEKGRELYSIYNQILSGLVKMIKSPENWLIG